MSLTLNLAKNRASEGVRAENAEDRAESDRLKWLRVTKMARIITGELGIAADDYAVRAMTRDDDSLWGLAQTLHEQGRHRVTMIGAPEALPPKPSLPKNKAVEPHLTMAIERRMPVAADLQGSFTAAWLISDVPPDMPNLTRSAVLLPGGSAAQTLAKRVDAAGDVITTLLSTDELFAIGNCVLTVVSLRPDLATHGTLPEVQGFPRPELVAYKNNPSELSLPE